MTTNKKIKGKKKKSPLCIAVFRNEKKHSHNNVKADIYFTAVGLFDIPSEQALIETMNKTQEQNKSDEKSA